MAQLNKVLLIGNLTRDPEVRYTPKGNAVTDLGLAVNRSWKSETGEEKEEVCYITVTVWGKQAETAGKYLKKGRPLFVEGRLQYETWEKNGEKRSTIKVLCERFQFLGSGGSRDSENAPEEESQAPAMAVPAASKAPHEPDLEDDDIPF